MTEGVACVLPALNAERTLPGVAAGLRRSLPGALLIAVDDGSRDATAAAAEGNCDVVLRLATNHGKGAALRVGFSAALRRGCTSLLTIDADGQHDPLYAPSLLAALADADLVIGARERNSSRMPMSRRVTNSLASAAVGRCTGRSLPDTQSGFRALRADVVHALRARGDRYEYETELLIAVARAGYRIATVPVSTVYGAPSHFRPVRDGARVVRAIWRNRSRA